MSVYTEAMLASLFNVTTTSPYECDLENPVPVKGRKSYRNAMAVSIRVAENKAFGYAVSIMLLVDGHYRKCNGEYSQTKRRKVYKMRWVYKRKNRCLWRYGWQRSFWSLT